MVLASKVRRDHWSRALIEVEMALVWPSLDSTGYQPPIHANSVDVKDSSQIELQMGVFQNLGLMTTLGFQT